MIRSAVIGTGVISAHHLSFLDRARDVEVVAVCDLSAAAARHAMARFGAATSFTDYHDMLAETSPDVVHVLTPPQTHVEIAMDCLSAGAHVISEKPVALTFEEFERLWAHSKRVGRLVTEDQNYRFNRPVMWVCELIEGGGLGEVREVEVRLKLDIRGDGPLADENHPSALHTLPAGALHDFLPHMAYVLLHLSPVDSFTDVSVAWRNHGGGDLFTYDDLDAILLSGPVHGRLRFSACEYPGAFAITVHGTHGVVETDLYRPYLRIAMPGRLGRQLAPVVDHLRTGGEFMRAGVALFRDRLLQRSPYEGLERFLHVTYAALVHGEKPPIGFEEMGAPIRLIEQLLSSENRL